MKNHYIAVTVELDRNEYNINHTETEKPNPGLYSYVLKCNPSDNLISVLERARGLVYASIFPTKKEAESNASYWNTCHRTNGTYLGEKHMEKIRFSNISKSPMTAHSPAWQEKIMQRVTDEYSAAAIETSEKIREEFSKISAEIKPGYFGTAFNGIIQKTPRYVYIKHVETPFGEKYDTEIDLILHTVNFIRIETE